MRQFTCSCYNCSEEGASRAKSRKFITKSNKCKILEGDGEEVEGEKIGKKEEVKRKKPEEVLKKKMENV